MEPDNEQNERRTPADEPNSSAGDSRPAKPKTRKKSRPATAPARKRTPSASRALIATSGPPPDSSPSAIKLTIGVIGGTHGVSGELKLKLLTDHPEHLPTVKQVYLGDSDSPTAMRSIRFQNDQALILLEGVDTPEAGKLLGGLKVKIAGADARPLEEGEYFLYQLIGLRALSGDGTPIGTVTDLIETGANDVLVITPETGADILVPNHPRYVLDIVPEDGRITVELPVYTS